MVAMGNTQPLQQILLDAARVAMTRGGIPGRARILLDDPTRTATVRVTCAGRVHDARLRTLGDLADLPRQLAQADMG